MTCIFLLGYLLKRFGYSPHYMMRTHLEFFMVFRVVGKRILVLLKLISSTKLKDLQILTNDILMCSPTYHLLECCLLIDRVIGHMVGPLN